MFSIFKKRDLYIVPIAYLVFGLVLYVMQDQFIYLPDERAHGVCNLPPHVTTIDSDELRAYYIPFSSTEEHFATSTNTDSEPKRLAVYYHGNASNACDGMYFYPTLRSAGYSVLLVEYPGYAGDDARPTTQAILDTIPSAIDFIDDQEYAEVIAIGQSIGSGFASYHATLSPVNSLFLITPFDTLSARAQRAIWIYPAQLLLKTDLVVKEWAQSAERVHIIAATDDEIIPRVHTDRVYEALDPNTSTYTIIENTSHNTLYADRRFLEVFADLLRTPETRE